jgi:hypothetical protein
MESKPLIDAVDCKQTIYHCKEVYKKERGFYILAHKHYSTTLSKDLQNFANIVLNWFISRLKSSEYQMLYGLMNGY